MNLKRILRLLWLPLLVGLAVFVYWAPAANFMSRTAAALLVIGVAGSILAVCWRRRGLRVAAVSLLALLCVFVLLPFSPRTSAESLRSEYCAQLLTYHHVPYSWGGESHRFIDCSGLIRRGLMDATFKRGFAGLDPALVRHSLDLWWNDTSADALGKEHRGLTKYQFDAPNINSIDPAKLTPGDLAVTVGGVHIMAYLGNQEWIEADPGLGEVVIVKTPSDDLSFKGVPVRILRWTLLAR